MFRSIPAVGSFAIVLLPTSARGRRSVQWLLLSLCLLFALSVQANALQQRAEAMRDGAAPADAEVSLFSPRLLAEFYAERGYRNAWDDQRAGSLLKLARASREDGFDPEDFHADAVAHVIETGQLQAASEAQRAIADLLLSDALLRYVHHFRFGKYNPRHINPGSIFVEKADAEALKVDMELALATPDLVEELTAVLPNPPFYRHLKLGYQRYLEIADRGTWQDIPGGTNLSLGMQDQRVPLIREHLAVIDGYQSATPVDPEQYDADLVAAIKGFQQRSGLSQDGVVGPNTLRALNQPIDDRLLTIRANLERMRWLYNELPPDYLFVDVAAFRLHLFRDHQEVWTTRVITGTFDDQTPMFRDEMEHIVFNPTWSVPASIQKKMRGVSSRYKVIDRRTGRRVSGVNASNYKRYRIVQPAGPSNALGRVKFMFPNGHAIYLHDTPSRHLFARAVRTYSHGCVRVKDPLTLAQQVLNQPSWDQSTINRVVKRGKTRYVRLDEHLPVLLYYLTAFADEQGRVGFRRDVYKRDKRLFAALERPADTDRIAFVEPESEPESAAVTQPVTPSQPVAIVGEEGLSENSLGDDDAATISQALPPAQQLGTRQGTPSISILSLDEEGRFADPPVAVEGSAIDLQATLPPVLNFNASGSRDLVPGMSMLLPAMAADAADPVSSLLVPWPPES
ncbi:MAG TPA: murein L,D-transpeptidase [Chromatiaceae bacterium]|jgi:murein L,D-transpeptidase YcbB/YkuD|nr:murein L,D-transpeptidase [Chromatiaceae bacterium]